MARRALDGRTRRPARTRCALRPRCRLLRRPAVHGRRCAVLVRGGVRREERQRQPGRLAPGGGKKLAGHGAPTRTRSSITFPAAVRAGLRILDNLPILPRHKLEAALEAGTFAKAWGLTTPPSDIVGPRSVRPVSEYLPGQRLVFDAQPALLRARRRRRALPYLDRLVVEIIPDQNAELLRLESGSST